jgi:DNA-binding NarL/FixJ family response regulator
MTITIRKILIVDDSAVMRRNLSKLIGSHTEISCVIEAETVDTAIQRINDEWPDVVVVDLQLSDETGFEILEFTVRQEHAPIVIVLTNFPSVENRRRAKSLGASYFFDKSFEYEKVIDVLNETPCERKEVAEY